MTIGTILRYQIGERRAIEEAANNRGTLITGFVLVLMTAVARNYDQTFILESPLWLLGPVLFSLVSGTFLFLVIYRGFIRRHLQKAQDVNAAGQGQSLKELFWMNAIVTFIRGIIRRNLSNPGKTITNSQWRTFMGLFWMTAPIGWLYAIPVERFLSSYDAAKANLILLGVVALGRVLLMGRIISVVQGMDWKRAVGWVLIPAAIEVLVVVFVEVIASGHLARHILADMAGMRYSPEEGLVTEALFRATTGAVVILGLVGLWLNLTKFDAVIRAFPLPGRSQIPFVGLLILALVWVGIAIPEQRKQARFVEHAKLIRDGKYRDSVDYLAKYHRADFPASRRLQPDPYEVQVFEQLPAVISTLTPGDPAWVRDLYLNHLTIMFTHRAAIGIQSNYVPMFQAISQLPEGKAWAQKVHALPMLRADAELQSHSETGSNAFMLTNYFGKLAVPVDLPTNTAPHQSKE